MSLWDVEPPELDRMSLDELKNWKDILARTVAANAAQLRDEENGRPFPLGLGFSFKVMWTCYAVAARQMLARIEEELEARVENSNVA